LRTVSVILPVYNGLPYLGDALDSILVQSFQGFELIVINDGSTDNSDEIIRNINDPRVHYVNQSNKGLAATLNNGIQIARGIFIARLDQDDLMLQSRLDKQVEYLESHPDCAMVGTWSEILVGNSPTDRGHKHPTSHETLQLELLFDNPFVHSSVMIRADVLRDLGGYSEDKSRQPPEDYELWSRISRKYRVANIPEVLTVYREVEGSMSRTGDNPFLANVIQISAENLAGILGSKFSDAECYSLASTYHGRKPEKQKNKLTKSRALRMHNEAALIISGGFSQWSDEFKASYNRQQSQIKSQFMRRLLPKVLLKPARDIRNLIKKVLLIC
jgi:glycosyltransferase involved in cell wall biosynthesis